MNTEGHISSFNLSPKKNLEFSPDFTQPKGIHMQDGGSARDIFCGSGFIHKEYIMSPLTSIINFRHFHSFLASYSKIPTQYFYFERLLPGPINTLNPGGNHLK